MSRRDLALSALSGLLLAFSFPTVGLGFLAWFGLLPLFAALKGSSVVKAFRLGFSAGIVFFAGTIYWVTNSVHFYGHIPLVPASFITLLLCAYCALFPAFFSAVIAYVRQSRPSLVVAAAPVVWTALELARTHLLSGFPWSLLGYSQYAFLPVVQFADLTGVYGVSFLIVLVNSSLAAVIEDRKRYVPLAVCAALLAAALAYGYHRLHAPAGSGGITIAVVQGNIEQDKKWDPAYQSEVIATYKRLTLRTIAQRPDLVIWPETATPFYFGGSAENAVMTGDLKKFVRSAGTPLLTGSPTYEVLPGRVVHLRNSAFLLDKEGGTASVYHKLHLVPFGEYVPLKSVLFFVEKMVQAVGDFRSGTEHTVMKIRAAGSNAEVAISTVICYEIIFPDLVRRFVKDGAAVMTTITNDAWFGRTGAPFQHFSMAVLRAIENRVPIARAANTGISGFIDAKGHILAASGIFTEAQLTRTLTPGTTRTFYTRFGDVFAWFCVIAGIAVIVVPVRKKS